MTDDWMMLWHIYTSSFIVLAAYNLSEKKLVHRDSGQQCDSAIII